MFIKKPRFLRFPLPLNSEDAPPASTHFNGITRFAPVIGFDRETAAALDENISALIGRIYEGVDDPALWEAVLDEVRERLGLRCLMQSIADLDHREMHRNTVIGNPRRPEGVDAYREYAYELDESFRWATEHPNARFCDTAEIVPRENYLEQDFVQWNLNNWLGSTHWLVGYSSPSDELTFGLSAHPWPEDGPLESDKKSLFKMLFEHIERAIRLSARPPLFANSQECVILVDRLGHICEMSPAARELLERQDGLTVWQRQLKALDSNSTARLDQAILSALTALRDGGFGGAVALPRKSGERDLLVTVSPLVRSQSPFEAFLPAAIVRIVDPELGSAPSAAGRWSEMFGLSPAEARLAQELIGGDRSLRGVADQLGVTYHTARVHLKHLLEKTGTHSQSQLTRLLSRVD